MIGVSLPTKTDLVVVLEGRCSSRPMQMLHLQEAGGTVTDFAGKPFAGNNNGRIVGCSSKVLHSQFLQFTEEVCSYDGN